MGWVSAEVVSLVRDDSGRVVRQVVERESEWSADERHLMLAFRDLEASTGSHGFLMSEATDPTASDPDGDYRFEAGEPLWDEAERVRAAAYRKLKEEHKDDHLDGVIIPVRKVYARD